MRERNVGDVVTILIGDYAGGNGRIVRLNGRRILVEVDPFGKTQWFSEDEIV